MTPPRIRIKEYTRSETQDESINTSDRYSVLNSIRDNLIALDKNYFAPKFEKLESLIGRSDLSMAEIKERREIIQQIESWIEWEIKSILAQDQNLWERIIDKIPVIGTDTAPEKPGKKPSERLSIWGLGIRRTAWTTSKPEEATNGQESVQKQVDFNHKRQLYTDYLKLKNTELQSPYIESIISLLDSMWVWSYKNIDFSRHAGTAKFIEEVEKLIKDLINDKK